VLLGLKASRLGELLREDDAGGRLCLANDAF
jgi:hypothetical protein